MLSLEATSAAVSLFMLKVLNASPLEKIKIEIEGVPGMVIKGMSKQMGLTTHRFFSILGLPKATAEKRTAAGELIKGISGLAAIGMVELLAQAQVMADNSTAEEAKTFDSAKWLGKWIETPLLALGGNKPADVIESPTGVAVVKKLLGSIERGLAHFV